MLTGKPLLSMIAHGTDGSDGIEPGIHLRWVFHSKMGFPPAGFILYRRQSDTNKRICLDIESIHGSRLNLPYKYNPRHKDRPLIKVRSESRKFSIETLVMPASPLHSSLRVRAVKVDKPSEIFFMPRTGNIEIEFFARSQGKTFLTAWSGNTRVEEKIVSVRRPGRTVVTIQGYHIDRLQLKGDPIHIIRICFWVCSDAGLNPWEPINDRCGFGLPFGISKRTKYIESTYRDECDTGWAVARCRLGDKKACEFEGDNFQDMKDIIEEMAGDGIKVPIGWSLMKATEETALCPGEEEGPPEMKLSPYDLLLMQSQNPDIARMLGLYWVDNTVESGKYYDYKVIAYWPERPRILWRLENEVTFEDGEIGHSFYTWLWKKKVVFHGPKPRILVSDYLWSRVKKGLSFDYPNNVGVVIYFAEPVREVQIFITQLGKQTGLYAYSGDGSTPVDKDILKTRAGVLSVHSVEPIKRLHLKGRGIIISRIHYDQEYLPYGSQKFVICGVRKGKPTPLPKPTGIKATCLRGSITRTGEDCTEVICRLRAGLRWDIPGNLDAGLFSSAPVGYHIRRITPRDEIIDVTQNSPVHVVPIDPEISEEFGEDFSQVSCIEGVRVKERQYFQDAVDEKGHYDYQVAAVDLFGRVSAYSNKANVDLVPPLPPPPANVRAKFLDYTTYEPKKDTFSDPNLNQEEMDWLRTNQVSAIKVRWDWPENLHKQAPDALGFKVYLKHGWFNLLRGTVTSVNGPTSEQYRLSTDLNLDSALLNRLRDEWLRQGKMIYKIRYNTTGLNSKIRVKAPPGFFDFSSPSVDKPFIIPLTRLTDDSENPGAAVHMTDPVNWDGGVILDFTIQVPGWEHYEVYIPIRSSVFPKFAASAADEEEKTRYAQIGVSTYSEEGGGSVSPPAAIIAIDRRKPAPKELVIADEVGVDLPALMASPADYYGKSSFSFQWPKAVGEVKYFVYRAMDETLFMVDKAQRENGARTNAFYTAFLNRFCSGLDSGGTGLNLTSQEKNLFKAASPDYSSFTNKLLKALASLPDNEEAFALLNDKPIDPNEAAVEDNSGLLEYHDKLDGLGDNRYLYRVRPVDVIGNLGPFSYASLPVEIPKTAPPVAPTITKISGGDRQITIKWTGNPSANIKGYLVYRTDDKQKSKDARRMELIKINTGDEYSVEVTSSTQMEFEYIDKAVEARKKYFYGIIAVSEGENQQKFYSKISAVRGGQAYQPPPLPPIWNQPIRQPANNPTHVLLSWTHSTDQNLACLVEWRTVGGQVWTSVSGWLPAGTYVYEDSPPHIELSWEYRLRVKDNLGQSSNMFPTVILPASS